MSTDASIQSLAKAINASWRKTTDSVLDTAKLCANANDKLKVDEKKKLFELLVCSSATFAKLAKIGEQEALQSDPIKSLLPPNYTIVYEIAKLHQADLAAAVEKGIINHRMTRADILAWVAERNSAGVKTFTGVKPVVIGTLQVSPDYDETRKAQLEKELERLRAKYGFSLERPYDPLEAEQHRFMQKVSDYIRKHARQFIKDLKARKIKDAGVKLTEAQKKRAWPYAEDEVEVAHDAGWERIAEVLDFVGHADQFKRIKEEAFGLFDMRDIKGGSHIIHDEAEAMAEVRKMIAERNARLNQMHDPEKYADWK